MAQAPKKPEPAKTAADSKAAKPVKKRGKAVFAAIAALIASGGGGAAWYLMTEPSNATALPAQTPPVFVPLDTFTVNLQPERSREYLQIGLSVKLTHADAADPLKTRMPEIRSKVLLLLTSKTSAELLSVEGKQKLANEILAEVKRPFGHTATEKLIDSVLFTSFVIQ